MRGARDPSDGAPPPPPRTPGRRPAGRRSRRMTMTSADGGRPTRSSSSRRARAASRSSAVKPPAWSTPGRLRRQWQRDERDDGPGADDPPAPARHGPTEACERGHHRGPRIWPGQADASRLGGLAHRRVATSDDLDRGWSRWPPRGGWRRPSSSGPPRADGAPDCPSSRATCPRPEAEHDALVGPGRFSGCSPSTSTWRSACPAAACAGSRPHPRRRRRPRRASSSSDAEKPDGPSRPSPSGRVRGALMSMRWPRWVPSDTNRSAPDPSRWRRSSCVHHAPAHRAAPARPLRAPGTLRAGRRWSTGWR